MTSALNHLPPLSGNKLSYYCFCIFVFLSCAAAKSSTDDKKINSKVQIVKADKSTVRDTVPNTKRNIAASKVDTIKWSVDTVFQAIKDEKQKTIQKKIRHKKDDFVIRLYIPLNSDGLNEQQASQSEFVHFYSGLLLSAEDLSLKGINFTIEVTDTEEGKFDAPKAASDLENDMPDIIIGPFEREDIKVIAEKAKQLAIPLFSPWQTSTKIATENPWYVQLKPNLKAHYQKIAEHVFRNFQKHEVAIIGRNNNDFNSWVNYFEELASQRFTVKQGEYFIKYYVNNDSLITGPTAFSRLLNNTKLKAVIIPNFSYNDELFVYNCVRKLSVEKGMKSLIAYGMPIIYSSDRIEYDHYYGLSMRLVMSDFVDDMNPGVRSFRRRFLESFGEIAQPAAVRGYDVMCLVGELLLKGESIQNLFFRNEVTKCIQHNFEIVPVRSDEKPVLSNGDLFDYFENKRLHIIEFTDSRFKIIE